MPAPQTTAELVELGQRLGLDAVGVAPAGILERARRALIERKEAGLHDGMSFTYKNPIRSTNPDAAVTGARSIIVAARSYQEQAPPPPSEPIGRVARYAWSDPYRPLRAALQTMALQLRKDGHRAVVFADDNSLVDREAAYLAGIGWFGKNANLLLPGRGSFFVLGSIITTASFESAPAPVADGCGSCRRCFDGCPTGAIVAAGVIDARKCLAWLLQRPGTFPVEYRAALGDRIYGCDDCQEVCPPNQRSQRLWSALGTDGVAGVADGMRASVPLLGLLTGTDEEVLAINGEWYLADRDPRWLRRNAVVIAGNLPTPVDSRILGALTAIAAGSDEMLAEHARWSLERLSSTHRSPTLT